VLGAGREDLEAAALRARWAPHVTLDLQSLDPAPLLLPDATEGEVWRGVIEACEDAVQSLLDSLAILAGEPAHVVSVGGWTRDRAVMDAKRRRGRPIRAHVTEAGCRGAALLAGLACGVYATLDDVPRPSLEEVPPCSD
jgi:sugar (pentulose or hexulose) kinase